MESIRKDLAATVERDMLKRLGGACANLSPVTQRLCREVIEGIAYACSFSRERRFGDVKMNADSWRVFAKEITAVDLMTIASALGHAKHAGNRLFYILGCAARIYGRNGSQNQIYANHKKTNFTERNYTEEEMKSVMVTIDQLDDIDL